MGLPPTHLSRKAHLKCLKPSLTSCRGRRVGSYRTPLKNHTPGVSPLRKDAVLGMNCSKPRCTDTFFFCHRLARAKAGPPSRSTNVLDRPKERSSCSSFFCHTAVKARCSPIRLQTSYLFVSFRVVWRPWVWIRSSHTEETALESFNSPTMTEPILRGTSHRCT